jgi:hypothetical protein
VLHYGQDPHRFIIGAVVGGLIGVAGVGFGAITDAFQQI